MSRDIVSIDVGIRNLAYCISRLDTHTISVVAWNTIDLAGAAPKCVGIPEAKPSKKRKSVDGCRKPIAYKLKETAYCATCAARIKTAFIPSREHCAAALQRRNSDELVGLATELGVALPENSTKHAIVAILVSEYRARSFVKLPRAATGATMDMVCIARAIVREFDAVPLFSTASQIIIESQIGPQAVRMKGVQGMLTQYFVMRNPDAEIRFVSSGNKLRVFSNKSEAESQAKSKSGTEVQTTRQSYATRKSASTKHTTAILAETPVLNEWMQPFLDSRKKDDFADCFLQLVWFLCSTGDIAMNGYTLARII